MAIIAIFLWRISLKNSLRVGFFFFQFCRVLIFVIPIVSELTKMMRWTNKIQFIIFSFSLFSLVQPILTFVRFYNLPNIKIDKIARFFFYVSVSWEISNSKFYHDDVAPAISLPWLLWISWICRPREHEPYESISAKFTCLYLSPLYMKKLFQSYYPWNIIVWAGYYLNIRVK